MVLDTLSSTRVYLLLHSSLHQSTSFACLNDKAFPVKLVTVCLVSVKYTDMTSTSFGQDKLPEVQYYVTQVSIWHVTTTSKLQYSWRGRHLCNHLYSQ